MQVHSTTYEEGRKAYVDGDYDRAYKILAPLARDGDSEAQKMLGIMYDYGHGVTADPKKSLKWYIRSAEQGQPAVQYQVGAKFFRGDGIKKDLEEAAKWWELAANGGQVDAQFNLGLMYFRGLAVKKDEVRASELFEMAANQGHSHAQYSLGVIYAFGKKINKDYATALKWFTKSAEQGVPQAQYNLGVFYENGYAVDKNTETARLWYEKAASQGLPEAKTKLAGLENIGQTEAQETAVVATPAAAEVAQQAEPASATGSVSERTILEEQYSLSEISTNTIRREDWLLKQPPNTYTLQIASVTSENAIINFIKNNMIESESCYIQVVINGVTRFNAFYGSYQDYGEAQAAIDILPDRLRRAKPWVRNIGVLQKMLN